MKILEKNKEKIVFAEEMSESLANAIRRSALEIPILAIDEVEFYKNDSVLYDEVLALRLGLVPLKNENLELPEDCNCEGKGCGKCSIQLKLKAVGKKSVLASDFKGKAEVIYGDMLIIELAEEQELELVATAKLGRGIWHAKYSPGLVYYRNAAELSINKNCDKCNKCVESCPVKILEMKKEVELTDSYKCDLCEACVETCKKHGKNAITIAPGKEIVFFIESCGQIEAKDILIESIKALKNNLKKVEKA